MAAFLVFIGILLAAGMAQADYLQYDNTSMRVTGYSVNPIDPVPDRDVIQTPAPVVWPVPTAEPEAEVCVGAPQYTLVTDPALVASGTGGLAVRAELFFFATTSNILPGCHEVGHKQQLRDLMSHALIDQILNDPENQLMLSLNAVNEAIEVICPSTDSTTNCVNARDDIANVSQTPTMYPSKAALANFAGQIKTLKNDVVTFIQARGW